MILATADVTILGAGVFGLSIAFCAAQRGARVRVIDPAGVAQGASGGLVGALAPHTPDLWLPKKQFQLESLLLAREFWPEVERLSGLPTGYANHGRLQPINEERLIALALSRMRMLRQIGEMLRFGRSFQPARRGLGHHRLQRVSWCAIRSRLIFIRGKPPERWGRRCWSWAG